MNHESPFISISISWNWIKSSLAGNHAHFYLIKMIIMISSHLLLPAIKLPILFHATKWQHFAFKLNSISFKFIMSWIERTVIACCLSHQWSHNHKIQVVPLFKVIHFLSYKSKKAKLFFWCRGASTADVRFQTGKLAPTCSQYPISPRIFPSTYA